MEPLKASVASNSVRLDPLKNLPHEEPREDFGDEDELRETSSTCLQRISRKGRPLAVFAIFVLATCLVAATFGSGSHLHDRPSIVTSPNMLETGPPTVNAPRLVAGMESNPNYNFTTSANHRLLEPDGYVKLRFDDKNRFLMAVHVTGLQPNCTKCHVAILQRHSCFNVSDYNATSGQSLHAPVYWNPHVHPQNPWATIHYQTNSAGQTDFSTVVFGGLGPGDVDQTAVVLYDQDYTPEPLACGILRPESSLGREDTVQNLFASIKNLPTYYMTTVDGDVRVEFFHDSSMLIDFSLSGLPPRCVECKIAIQEGTSCEVNAGSHYWNHEMLERDPWAPFYGAFYSSDVNGISQGSFFTFNGFDLEDHIHHVVIVHGPDGTRIACGPLLTQR